MGYDNRDGFWFGTAEYGMEWIRTPNRGAEMNPEGWSEGGTLLNGGGFQLNSFGSHKTYIFEWPDSSSREAAMKMKAYSDGTYGRGLLYFLDPLIYDQNILPALWADPSIVLGYEGASHVYGVNPTATLTTDFRTYRLPRRSVTYDLTTVPSGFRGTDDAVFVPIPEDYSLYLSAMYSYASDSTARVYFARQTDGVIGTPEILPPSPPSNSSLFTNDGISDVEGVWLFIGRSSSLSGTRGLTLTAMTARLAKTSLNPAGIAPSLWGYGEGPYGEVPYGLVPVGFQGGWTPGMGHSGCRFMGKPSYVANTGVDGGQISYAASFREVGSWA